MDPIDLAAVKDIESGDQCRVNAGGKHVYSKYSEPLLGYVKKYIEDHRVNLSEADAEDMVMVTMESVVKKAMAGRVDPNGNLKAYIFTTARNKIVSRFRAEKERANDVSIQSEDDSDQKAVDQQSEKKFSEQQSGEVERAKTEHWKGILGSVKEKMESRIKQLVAEEMVKIIEETIEIDKTASDEPALSAKAIHKRFQNSGDEELQNITHPQVKKARESVVKEARKGKKFEI